MDNNGLHGLTLGSLFDGIGGFPFAAELSGVKPLWAAEVNPFCVALTRQLFPDMTHYGNVAKLSGADLPPVDIISFGSPCQDVSVAGKRKGIKHTENGDEETTRSGMLIEAIRIIYEMREATNGRYPTFIIWENVAGAFTSNSGGDFRKVLEEITKTDIPMPTSGKWAHAGMVRGGELCVCWRLFDSQYWGVPQRRKRIYLVGSFGSECAAEILFKRDGVQRYLAPRRTTRKGFAADIKESAGNGDFVFDCRGNGNGAVFPTMTGDHNNRVTDYTAVILQQKNDTQSPCIAFQNSSFGGYTEGIGTIRATAYKRPEENIIVNPFAVAYGVDCRNGAINEELYPTLQAKENGGQSLNYMGAVLHKDDSWIVRRPTPLECERLQGYPDDWTILRKIEVMTDEEYEFFLWVWKQDKEIERKKYKTVPNKRQLTRWHNKLCNDTARYKALGNSLAIPCALRVVGYIADYVRGAKK